MTTKLRVWWAPQVPCQRFFVDVASVDEARKMLDVLARYDAFQLEHNIKPDYCNAGGLEEFVDGEWCECNDEDGNDLDDLARLEAAKVASNRAAGEKRARADARHSAKRRRQSAARSRA